MLTNVQMLQNERYLINDVAVLSNLTFGENGANYTVEYDENVITSSEADELVESFICKIGK